jgi:phospholipid-binding lipoprotein MlaA
MTQRGLFRFSLLWLVVLLLAGLVGCAAPSGSDPRDPFESYNRSVTRFNDNLDEAVLKPVAQTYVQVTPSPVRTGVKNFFGNLGDVWSTLNNAMQLKPKETVESLARVLVNTVVGIYGLFDVATELNLTRHAEDFGQTLGYWGVPSGPYLVLPVLGPSTLRDTASLSIDTQGNLVRQIDHVPTRNTLWLTGAVDKRSRFLDASDQVDALALDKYIFLRDVFLQKRLSDVWDGNPPEAPEETEEPKPE